MREWNLRSGWLRLVAVLVALYLLVTLAIGWYWSREPDFFPVQQHAQEAAAASGRKLVLGYTTVETLKQVAGTLLDKPGGYLSNDIFPPGLWLDDMPSWEYGVLVQTRDLARALRKDFARSQSQSTEDVDLAQPSRASTSTTTAGPCPRRNRNTAPASPPWTATWRAWVARMPRASPPPTSIRVRTTCATGWVMSRPAWVRCPSGCPPASVGFAWTPRCGRTRTSPPARCRRCMSSASRRPGCRSTMSSTRPAVRPGRCRTSCAPSRSTSPTPWPRRTPR